MLPYLYIYILHQKIKYSQEPKLQNLNWKVIYRVLKKHQLVIGQRDSVFHMSAGVRFNYRGF